MDRPVTEYQSNVKNLLNRYISIKRLLEEEHNQIITNETNDEILTFFVKNPPIEFLEHIVKELNNFYEWLGEKTNESPLKNNQISFTIDEFFSADYFKQSTEDI